MANTTINISRKPIGADGHPARHQDGRAATLPVAGGAHIFEGTLVAQLTGTGMLVPGSTAGAGPCIGVATQEVDNTAGPDGAKRCYVEYERIFAFQNGAGDDACSDATLFDSPIYMLDDHTIGSNDRDGALQRAGTFRGMEPAAVASENSWSLPDGGVRVLVGGAASTTFDLSPPGPLTEMGVTSSRVLDVGSNAAVRVRLVVSAMSPADGIALNVKAQTSHNATDWQPLALDAYVGFAQVPYAERFQVLCERYLQLQYRLIGSPPTIDAAISVAVSLDGEFH